MKTENIMPEKLSDTGLIWAVVGAFGAFGGIARFLHEVASERRKFSWLGLVCYAFVSGFLGVLFGLLPAYYGMSLYAVMFTSGAAGGIGWACMTILEWFIRAKAQQALKHKAKADAS